MGTGEWIGIVGALVAALVTIWVYRRERDLRILDYETLANFPLLMTRVSRAVFNNVREEVTVSYKGVQVKRPRIVTIRVQNTGSRAVSGTTFQEPIRVKFADHPPMTVSVARASNRFLEDCEVSLDSAGTAAVTPRLMNAKDWFDLQFICDGQPGHIEVTCWFEDQSRPMKEMDDRVGSAWAFLLVTAILSVSFGCLFASVFVNIFHWPYLRTAAYCVGALFVLMQTGYWVPKWRNRHKPKTPSTSPHLVDLYED